MAYKVIQCGYPKSGNYFLWKLISLCQKRTGKFCSFFVKSGFSKVLQYLFQIKNLKPAFKEYFEVDDIQIKRGVSKVTLASLPGLPNLSLEVDQELVLHTSSLIWTHSTPGEVIDFALKVPIRIYLVRDGRDVVNSFIHHSCRENIRKLYGYKISDPRKVYERLDVFEKYVREWNNHIREFLKLKRLFIEVRFEKLINFGEDFSFILELFSLKSEEDSFKKELTFERLKAENKEHVRKGKIGDWKNYFTDKHKEIFKEVAGETLIKLGYEKDFNW